MGYYRSAFLVSFAIVAVPLLMYGKSEFAPIYIVFTVLGGLLPSVLCVRILRQLAENSVCRNLLQWILCGVALSFGYSIASYFLMHFLIPKVGNPHFVKSLTLLMTLGPALLIDMKAWLTIVFLGVANGAVLYSINYKEDKN